MTIINIENGQNRIYNDAGFQIIGSTAPNSEGLSPRELLEAALGLCVSITLQKIIERDGLEYDKSEISIKVLAVKAAKAPSRFSKFIVHTTLPSGLDLAYKEQLKEEVENTCTISNTLHLGADIELVEV